MIYGYIRISTDRQSVENQRFEINNFCERESSRSVSGITPLCMVRVSATMSSSGWEL